MLKFFLIAVFALVQVMSYGQMKPMEAKMPDIKLISAYDVEEKVDGKMARSSTVEIIFQPKGASMPHRHPGPVYGYVLEGTFEFKVEGKPLRTLEAGNTFYETRMVLH
ncbi:MAG: cupin domain-containing protein, partial [Flavobacteriaceae bacterium]